MKCLLFAALFVIGCLQARAQTNWLYVVNSSPCTMVLEGFAGTISDPACGTTSSTGAVIVPPGTGIFPNAPICIAISGSDDFKYATGMDAGFQSCFNPNPPIVTVGQGTWVPPGNANWPFVAPTSCTYAQQAFITISSGCNATCPDGTLVRMLYGTSATQCAWGNIPPSPGPNWSVEFN